MKIDLPPDLEKMIADKVNAGEYANAGEVVREALLLMSDVESRDAEDVEWLRGEIEAGRKDFEEGRYTTFKTDEELKAFFDSLK